MAAFLEGIEFWWWWALAVLLVVIEILAPGFVFLWFAVAAAAMGVVLLLVPSLSWPVQLAIFAVLAVAALALGRRYFRRKPSPPADNPKLNRRSEQYIGRHLTLSEPITDGVGWAKVDDSRWRVAGPDLPAGTHVKVVGVDGATLQVEAVTQG